MPDVRSFVCSLSFWLFRRHIRCCAQNDTLLCSGVTEGWGVRQIRFLISRKCFRQSKVEHLHLFVRCDLDVGWLQVAMDDAFLVAASRASAICRASSGFLNRNRTGLYPISKRIAFDKLKDKEVGSAGFLQSVNGGDVRMIQGGQQFSSRWNRATDPCLWQLFRQHLDCHFAPEFLVFALYTSPIPPLPSWEEI